MGLLLQSTHLLERATINRSFREAFLPLLIVFRGKSTDDRAKRASVIKTLNYENKQLYGAVMKRPKNTSRTLKSAEKQEKTPSNKSSEVFWMQKPQKPSLSLPNSLLALQQSLPPHPETPRSPKISEKSTRIPFDEDTLKELVDFPLIFNKKHPIENLSAPEVPKLPSVGRILQATMPEASREALMRWKILKIAELGEEGFRELNQKHLREGARLHGWIEEFFKTRRSPEEALVEGGWKSVEKFLQTVDPRVVEAKISHPFLKYHGIVDCVSVINSELHVIEWKKSERVKSNLAATFDAPLQLAAYLGAVNATLSAHGLATPVLRGAVVVVYADGTPANVHSLGSADVRLFWRSWLLRLQEYWIRARDGTLPEPI